MRATILRGVPGSGKSTWAEKNRPDAVVCSADHFFTFNGEYRFNRDELPAAHDACLRKFVHAVHDYAANIVVDNTNVSVAEIAPYYRVAEAMGYEVEVVWFHTPWEIAAARNVHGVPADVVRKMSLGFEPLPPWWNVVSCYESAR